MVYWVAVLEEAVIIKLVVELEGEQVLRSPSSSDNVRKTGDYRTDRSHSLVASPNSIPLQLGNGTGINGLIGTPNLAVDTLGGGSKGYGALMVLGDSWSGM